ncbi:hypothetical protein LJR009_005314 [Bosea sp. LjRoot9]|uniref:hypothetical protein n=1 Tax=Bosea sp. LjRoot9 TaxID=3342341 RepID=UPI003ECC5450
MTDKPDLAEIEAAVQAAQAQAEAQRKQPAAASDTGSMASDGVGDVVIAVLDGTLETVGSVLSSAGEAAASVIGGIFEGLGS